jgi:hypothetical protein
MMHYCPNPSCSQNLRKTKKPFSSVKSFSNHVQQSPKCKPFVFEQAIVSAPTMQAPSKRASINTSSTDQLFKKQRLWKNPTFPLQQHTNNSNSHSIVMDETVDDDVVDDDDVSLSERSALSSSGSVINDNFFFFDESFGLLMA